jgi:hypothetical protein
VNLFFWGVSALFAPPLQDHNVPVRFKDGSGEKGERIFSSPAPRPRKRHINLTKRLNASSQVEAELSLHTMGYVHITSHSGLPSPSHVHRLAYTSLHSGSPIPSPSRSSNTFQPPPTHRPHITFAPDPTLTNQPPPIPAKEAFQNSYQASLTSRPYRPPPHQASAQTLKLSLLTLPCFPPYVPPYIPPRPACTHARTHHPSELSPRPSQPPTTHAPTRSARLLQSTHARTVAQPASHACRAHTPTHLIPISAAPLGGGRGSTSCMHARDRCWASDRLARWVVGGETGSAVGSEIGVGGW